jgi:hypothetical protein
MTDDKKSDKGLRCRVLLPKGDKGEFIGSRYKDVVLVGPGIPEIFSPEPDMPIVRLKENKACTINRYVGTEKVESHVIGGRCLVAVPDEEVKPGNVGWMMSGAFIWNSDNRFPSRCPIPLHDLTMTREYYLAQSEG